MNQKLLFLLLCTFSINQVNFSQSHFVFAPNTGNNATIVIQTIINPNINRTPLASGDEIGVFTPAGLCVGAVVWNNSNTSITVWGDDAQTVPIDGIVVGEAMSFRVWDQSANQEISNVNVTYNSNPPFNGSGLYQVNGLYNLLSLDGTLTTDITDQESSNSNKINLIASIYPNPFNSSAKIKLELSEASNVRITLLDILGKEIEQVFDSFVNEGNTEIDLHLPKLSSGIYFLLTRHSENTSMNKISNNYKTVLINKIILVK